MGLRNLTNSMRSKFNACHRAFKLNYEDLRRPINKSEALNFGTAMHKLLEAYWSGKPHDFDIDAINIEDEYMRKTIIALYGGYIEKWYEEDYKKFETIGVEVGFEAPLMNPETGGVSKTWQLAGKIDAIAKEKSTGKILIVEHKTTSQDIGTGSDYWKKLPIDGQVSGYYVGAQVAGYEPTNCLYDVIRKPSMRPSESVPVLDEEGLKIAVYEASGERAFLKNGKPRQSASKEEGIVLMVRKETPDEWFERLTADIKAKPDSYFARLEIARSESDLMEYLYDMWGVAREISDAERMNRWSRNPASCALFSGCEYFDVCTGCANIDDDTIFLTADKVNEEL